MKTYLVYLRPTRKGLRLLATVVHARSAALAKNIAKKMERNGCKVFDRTDGYTLEAIPIEGAIVACDDLNFEVQT